MKEELLPMKINTRELFEKGFNFEDMAKFDFSSELLEKLDADQKNLNNDIDNPELVTVFLRTANEVSKKFGEKYSD